MRAVIVDGPGSFGVTSLPDPQPGPADLIVAVHGVGLCGTDMHLLDGLLPYDQYPLVPGHEFYGEVVEAGKSADCGLVGAVVAVDPNITCRACTECRRGRANLCSAYEALGITRDGACAEFVRVPAHLAYRLRADTLDTAAVLIEPLSCAVHGFDLLPRRVGDQYLIYGAGTMGLLMGQLATQFSSTPVVMVERAADRRAVAESLGFEAFARPEDLYQDRRWDTVVDCTGAVPVIEDGLTRVQRGGTFQCFGVAEPGATAKISPFAVYRNEITIVGSMAVHHSFDRAVQLAHDWGPEISGLVTHEFALESYADAVAGFRSGQGIKTVLRPAGVAA